MDKDCAIPFFIVVSGFLCLTLVVACLCVVQLLGIGSLVDSAWNRRYILSTQCSITGGFSKWPECHPGEHNTYLTIIIDIGIII